jgi:hypothetical protein
MNEQVKVANLLSREKRNSSQQEKRLKETRRLLK